MARAVLSKDTVERNLTSAALKVYLPLSSLNYFGVAGDRKTVWLGKLGAAVRMPSEACGCMGSSGDLQKTVLRSMKLAVTCLTLRGGTGQSCLMLCYGNNLAR